MSTLNVTNDWIHVDLSFPHHHITYTVYLSLLDRFFDHFYLMIFLNMQTRIKKSLFGEILQRLYLLAVHDIH